MTGSRRPLRRLTGLTVALALVGAACSSNGSDADRRTTDREGQETVTDDGAQLVRSKAAAAKVDPDEAPGGGAVVAAVGSDLYAFVAGTAGDGNVAYSPLSITSVLAQLRAGATGAAADQLDELFGVDDATLHRQMQALDAELASRTGTQDAGGHKGDVTVEGANAIWAPQDLDFNPTFLDTLAASYDSGMHVVDFAADPAAARAEINRWVGERTADHIPDLLPDGSISSKTRLVLTNALYFGAPWETEFDEVGDLSFAAPEGAVDVPGLNASGIWSHGTGDGYAAVTVPYLGEDLGFTILLPDESADLGDLERRVGSDGIAALLGVADTDAQVELTMPAFDMDVKTELTDAFDQIGVTDLVGKSDALKGIAADPAKEPLELSQVLHEATVTVDAKGTEATAATAAIVAESSAQPQELESVTLVVDRPYLFVIQDLATGAPLFVGRVSQPA